MNRKAVTSLSVLAVWALTCAWLGLAVSAKTIFAPVASEASPNVTVHYVDVGQGDCIFIDTSSKDVLIDGGNTSAGSDVLDYLGSENITRIHLMIATHVHADHIGGLTKVLNSTVDIDEILINNQTYHTDTYTDFMDLAQNHTLTVAERGQVFILTDTANLTIFNPIQPLEFPDSDDENDNSVVAKLQAGSVSFLFTGDAEADAEQSMIDAGLDLQSDVLKVGHHGSDTSTTLSFLDSVNPSYAIISAGGGYGHPHSETITKLLARDVTIYETYVSGTIVASTDGATVVFHSNLQPRTWTVDDDGPADYSSIQEAINAANPGDTIFVHNGTYFENVVVDTAVSLVGEDNGSTVIDGNETGRVIDIVSDDVNVTGFTVQGGGSIALPDLDAGICLNRASGCIILGNNIVDNGCFGIHLIESDQNTISGNSLMRNALFAIELSTSNDNILSSNIAISNPETGLGMHASSHNNTVVGNVVMNSTYGILLNKVRDSTISGNHLANNSEIGIWMQNDVAYNDVHGNNVSDSRCGIRIDEQADSNTLSGNLLTGSQFGIKILDATHTEIFNNTITHNYGSDWDAAIRLDYAGYSRIYSNLIVDNWRGILLYTSSPHVSIHGNNLTDNEFAVRVASGGSDYLNISDNIVMNSRGYGIGLTGFGGASNYATISRNRIVNNSDGILLGQHSNYNMILQNNISRNGNGFYIEHTTQNTIRGNNLVENDQQVYVSTSSVNDWDGGYHSGGNYWSDYNGTDHYKGTMQNITGSDGIGDTPYVIDGDNQDNYPLMYPWSIAPPSDTTPPTLSIVSPEHKTYATNEVSLTFTISESTSWIGYTLDGQANVTITGNTTLPELSDDLHSLIVYAEDASGNIGASEIVHFTIEAFEPEPFPTWTVVTIVTVAGALVTILIYLIRARKTNGKPE